jgi:hypothetical protein
VDDLGKLLSYLRGHPEEPVTRVSIATGVSEQAIAAFAAAGLLPAVPPGAEPEPPCTCNGRSRCPVCRAQVARRIAQATPGLTASPQSPGAGLPGMRSRRLR